MELVKKSVYYTVRRICYISTYKRTGNGGLRKGDHKTQVRVPEVAAQQLLERRVWTWLLVHLLERRSKTMLAGTL